MAAPLPPPLDTEQVRAKQRANARVMALVLGALVILFFVVSIAKIAMAHR